MCSLCSFYNVSNLIHISEKRSSSGRPEKNFEECTERTKRRKIQDITNDVSPDKLLFATKSSLHKQGKRAAADLLSQATEHSPSRPVEIRRAFKQCAKATIIPYTPTEALAFILNTGMTKDMYIYTRLEAKRRNANIYPAYEKVKEVKLQCYPEGIIVTNRGKLSVFNIRISGTHPAWVIPF